MLFLQILLLFTSAGLGPVTSLLQQSIKPGTGVQVRGNNQTPSRGVPLPDESPLRKHYRRATEVLALLGSMGNNLSPTQCQRPIHTIRLPRPVSSDQSLNLNLNGLLVKHQTDNTSRGAPGRKSVPGSGISQEMQTWDTQSSMEKIRTHLIYDGLHGS